MRRLLSNPARAGSVLVLLCLACTDGRTPFITQPPEVPPLATTGFIWGHVLAGSGVCLDGATVEIVAGPGTGQKVTQTVACDAWSYALGYQFSDLQLGVAVTLRATKAGYQPQERQTRAVTSGLPFQFVLSPE